MTTDSEGAIDAENRSVRFVRHYALGREDLWQAFTDPPNGWPGGWAP